MTLNACQVMRSLKPGLQSLVEALRLETSLTYWCQKMPMHRHTQKHTRRHSHTHTRISRSACGGWNGYGGLYSLLPLGMLQTSYLSHDAPLYGCVISHEAQSRMRACVCM